MTAVPVKMPLVTLRYGGLPPAPHREQPPPQQQSFAMCVAQQPQKKASLFGAVAGALFKGGKEQDPAVQAQAEADAFKRDFVRLVESGARLDYSTRCFAMHRGVAVPGVLYVTHTAVCFIGDRVKDAVPLDDVVAWLPSIALQPAPGLLPDGRPLDGGDPVTNGVASLPVAPSTPLAALGLGSAAAPTPSSPASSQGQGNAGADAEGGAAQPPNDGEAALAAESGVVQRITPPPPYIGPVPNSCVRPTALQLWTRRQQLFQFLHFPALTPAQQKALEDAAQREKEKAAAAESSTAAAEAQEDASPAAKTAGDAKEELPVLTNLEHAMRHLDAAWRSTGPVPRPGTDYAPSHLPPF